MKKLTFDNEKRKKDAREHLSYISNIPSSSISFGKTIFLPTEFFPVTEIFIGDIKLDHRMNLESLYDFFSYMEIDISNFKQSEKDAIENIRGIYYEEIGRFIVEIRKKQKNGELNLNHD